MASIALKSVQLVVVIAASTILIKGSSSRSVLSQNEDSQNFESVPTNDNSIKRVTSQFVQTTLSSADIDAINCKTDYMGVVAPHASNSTENKFDNKCYTCGDFLEKKCTEICSSMGFKCWKCEPCECGCSNGNC